MQIKKVWEEKDEEFFMIWTQWEGEYFTYTTSYLSDINSFTITATPKKDIFGPELIYGNGFIISFEHIKIDLERPYQIEEFMKQINELVFAADFFTQEYNLIRE